MTGALSLRAPAAPRGPRALVVAVAVAWVAMTMMLVGARAGAGPGVAMTAMPGMGAMPGMSISADPSAGVPLIQAGSAAAALAMWALMVVAMMVPTVLPVIRHVAAASLRRRRGRAVAIFTGAYVAMWLVAGLALIAAVRSWSLLPGWPALLSVAALAVGWQLTSAKRRALQDCHRAARLPLSGRAADVGVARFAAFHAWACVRSCWALMLAMAVVDVARPAWMVALSAVALLEKRAERPRRAARIGAGGIAAVAAVSALLLALG
jgi:predicted metal-binding membrane protein